MICLPWKPPPVPHLARILLLIDDGQRVLRRLPLGLSHCALHLGALGRDHVMGFPLGLRHGLLQLGHRLPLHLVDRLLCVPGRPHRQENSCLLAQALAYRSLLNTILQNGCDSHPNYWAVLLARLKSQQLAETHGGKKGEIFLS